MKIDSLVPLSKWIKVVSAARTQATLRTSQCCKIIAENREERRLRGLSRESHVRIKLPASHSGEGKPKEQLPYISHTPAKNIGVPMTVVENEGPMLSPSRIAYDV